MFSLEKICFAYPNEDPVIKNFSLEIADGERICILGANGCGKSTLLKILAALIFPQSGSFRAFGELINQKKFNEKFSKHYHRRIGFVFPDSDVQLFCSTVFEELAFGPLQLGLTHEEINNKIDKLAETLDIKKLLHKTPFHLSDGEKKKTAIAGVLIMDPDVLIMDEPTNALDPRSQSWLLRVIEALHKAGKTLIMATHNLEFAGKTADRAVLFDEDHRLAFDGPAREILGDREQLRRVNLISEDD
ncbi:MAG: energy-coupling factor ABC transporter ATP-binding protein [Spirochaetaceae bacterium]|jgi:cobalt/nickel transport system ATP-binding protein|nr:energy-coupling factor ABC transporter ATP-binding protein [Spirochaetaceae bacterium]